jgi:DNA repair exonuclease SbcCD ATPase subunit
MIGPWKRIKMAWYKREAKRAIPFLRYYDRVMHDSGMSRAEIKQAWGDFRSSPYNRMSILYQIARMNKIKIRMAKRKSYEKALAELESMYRKTKGEYDKLKADHDKCAAKAAEILADIEVAQMKEKPVEVPIV